MPVAPLLLASPLDGAPATVEVVEHPDPGLARGRWEAPEWVFYAVAAAAVMGGIGWAATAACARAARKSTR